MAKRKSTTIDDVGDLPFEETVARLEAIIEAMEHASLPLEELVNHYENGSKLLARCEAILNTARERVELITLRNSGTASTSADASLPANISPPSGTESADDDDDDIRLF